MGPQLGKSVGRYLLATGLVAAAVAGRLAINSWVAATVPFVQFYPAILIASWSGGFGPGVWAAALSAVASYIWLLMPVGLWKLPSTVDLNSLVLFTLVGVGIAWVSGAMKRAEAAQRRVAEQWRTTLASVGDAVIVTDNRGRITFMNGVAERLIGCEMSSVVDRPLDEVFVVANGEGEVDRLIDSPVARVLRDGSIANLATHSLMKRRDGEWIRIAASGSTIRSDAEGVTGVVLVFRDLTAERQAKHALRESQRLLQAISDNSPAVIYAKDLEGRYLLVNRRFSEIFRIRSEDVLGKTDRDLFDKADADRYRSMDQRVAAAGVPLTEEETVPLEDGVHTYISVKSPLRDDMGATYAIFGLSTDITANKRAEEALRANEERTRLIVETALDAIITIDSAGMVTGWSPQASTIFGWTREEVIGRSLAHKIIPPAYREAHRRGMRRFLATGEGPALNRRLELLALHRDGREFPIELSITPVRIGETVTFSAFVRDITDRKRMEQALVESQRYYQALTESLPNLVWTCRPDGYCDFLSRQWVDYTGRPAEEQIGYAWVEQLHPDDRDRVQAEWAQSTSRGDVFDVEFRIRRADGVYRWFKTRAVPLRDSSGACVKWFGSNTDVEDYKRSEQGLHAQLERLQLLDGLTRAIGERQDLQSILQVVIRRLEDHLPLDFCCVGLYDRASESLVVTRVGIKSHALALGLVLPEKSTIAVDRSGLSRCLRGQLLHEPDIGPIEAPFQQRLVRGGLKSLVVAPLAVESHVFGALIAARRESPGFSSADCEFLRQVSEHVALAAHQSQLHSALQQAYDDLRLTQQAVMQQERLKALGQMASGIAHDINNAISPVAVYTESLLETEPQLSDTARDYLSTIQRAVEDVAQTVARMREFYREREPQLALTSVHLNHLVQDIVDLTRARWSDMPLQRGVVIETAVDLTDGDPVVLGLESEIRDALINLIFNAVDAMPDGGKLTVRTLMSDAASGMLAASPFPGAHIEVSDTGIGMDPDTRRRCLEPFFTTKGERGTGLGLAMVYGMVQRHRAEIEIESELGRGTTIRLMFRLPPVAASDPVAPRRDSHRLSRLRVLLVDDDPLLLKTLRDVLESDGHIVSAANGGQAGIELFRSARHDGRSFDAVITDLGMPYVDGRQVATTIKQTDPSLPVILLTGWGQRLVEDGEVPPYVDRVLNKPPKLSELRKAFVDLTPIPARPA